MSISRISLPDVSLHHLAPDSVERKKKKRARQDLAQDDGANDHNKEYRKRKKHTKDVLASAQVDARHPTASHASYNKKRSRKNKEKKHGATNCRSDVGSDKQSHHAASSSPHASTTALLSTIVAAAAGTPDLNRADMSPQHHAMSFQYGFNPNTQFTPSQQPSPPPFINASLSFSDLNFGSNEDVLRALQDIDMSKIANVLKTLEDAVSAVDMPLPSLGYVPDPTSATSLGQLPIPSNTIITSTNNAGHRLRAKAVPQHTHPDHAHLLANKWLNASKLAELVKTEGLFYKKGKFSATEEQQIKAAIEEYRVTKGLAEDQIMEVIFSKNEKTKDNLFWSEITTAVPQRPIIAVYHHVRRIYHPLKLQGKWTPEEDDLLTQAVADLGQAWEKVSERVGRMSSDCRDRYRNHILDREIRATGPWTKEEEERLIRIVTKMTVERGKDFDSDVFWGKVSQEMGGKRGRQQCRIKWTDSLSKTVKNEGQKPRWNQQDAYILIHKVDSLEVNDDTEIDWKTLPDTAWNLWSAHALQRRWLTMKRGVPNFENMSHQEIIDTLKSKKGVLLPQPASSRRRKERRVTSAAAITEADLQRDTLMESNAANPSDRPKDS